MAGVKPRNSETTPKGGLKIRPSASNKLQPSSGVGAKIETLRDTLGTRQKAFSVGDATTEANPNYSLRYSAFSENCQRCVVAYELRRRGYDVTALPTYQGDKLPQLVTKSGDRMMARWMGAFQGTKPINISAKTGDKVISNIEQKMTNFGNGSRGVVQILYQGGGGHVFNVENVGGKITYIEAQTGKIKDITKTMPYVKPESVRLIRTDKLKISDRAKNFVTKRKGK